MNIDLDLILKFVGAIISCVSLGFLIYNILINNKKKLIDEFTVAKAFLEELDNINHPFVLIKGYQAIAGSKNVHMEMTKYLLLFPSPVSALDDYKFSMSLFVLPDFQQKHFKLKFKGFYKYAIYRKLLKWLSVILYAASFFYATLGYWIAFVFTGIYETILVKSSFDSFLFFMSLSFVIGSFCMYKSVRKGVAVKRAENLMSQQTERFKGLN